MLKMTVLLRSLLFFGVFLTFAFVFSYYTNSQSKSEIDEQSEKTEIPVQSVVDTTTHNLVGSYYTFGNGTDSKLLLNNKGNTQLEVQPTLYDKDGQELQLPPVWVEPQNFRFINLAEWAAIGGESFRQGNIKLFHYGKDLVLGAQIYLTDETRSLSYEEKLAEKGKFDSRRQEAVWWMPSNNAKVKIVMTNTTDAPLSVTGKLAKKPNNGGDSQIFELTPHQTKTFDLRNDFPGGNQVSNAEIIALSLAHTGAKDALLARVMVEEAQRGYSNVVQFANPAGGKTSEYQGVGFQIEDVAGQEMTPVIVTRNVGTTPATVTAQIPYTRVDGTRGNITLPSEQLSSGEMRTLNVQRIIQRVRQENIKVASLEVTYDSAPGSVIVAAHSVSTNRNQVFRVPMWDPLGQRSPTGGYPWRIDETSQTQTYIKNITDYEEDYVAFLVWENGGIYMIGLKPIGARETVQIDVKKLRDEQIPDERGRTIPLSISSGQLQWTLRRKDNRSDEDVRANLALIGRSEQVDLTKGFTNNYACQNCCSGDFIRGYLEASDPNQTFLPLEVQSSRGYFAVEEQQTCYGYPYIITITAIGIYNATWNTSNSSIATVTGGASGNVTGVNAGNVQISATWRRQNSYVTPCPPGGGNPPLLFGDSEEKQCTVKPETDAGNSTEKSDNEDKKNDAPIDTPNLAACGTCVSRFSNYTANLNLEIKPKIRIFRDGTDITSTPQNTNEQNVIVGQRINLTAQITGGSASTQQWTIPEKAIDRFETLNGAGLPDTSRTPERGSPAPIPVNKLTSNQVDFIWHSGGGADAYKLVQYTATVNGISATAKAQFDVKRPTVSQTSVSGTTQVDNTVPSLDLTGAGGQDTGIIITRNTIVMPNGFSGDFQFVQLINATVTRTRLTNPPSPATTTNLIGLDGCYPYAPINDISINDKPGGPLAGVVGGITIIYQNFNYNGRWNVYLMFRPTGMGSEWVTLNKLDWTWQGEANLIAGSNPLQWTANDIAPPGNPSGSDNNSYPQWSSWVRDPRGCNF